jgi:hypothetical protein
LSTNLTNDTNARLVPLAAAGGHRPKGKHEEHEGHEV